MSISQPVQTISSTKDKGNWQEDFLQRILIISAIFGLFALIPAVMSADEIILQGVYIGVYTILVASILIRIPYKIKAGIFVTLPLILGIGSLSEVGIRGDCIFWLLAHVAISALLIGYQGGVISIMVSEIVIGVSGFLMLNGYFTPTDPRSLEGTLANWITSAVSQLMISLVVMLGIRMLQAGFDQARSDIEEMLETVRDSQAGLEERVEERTQELARKTNQMTASTIVAHQTASIQDMTTLLNSTVDLIAKQFGYYYVSIFLINPRGDYATLQAASSEAGKQLVDRGFNLRVGTEGIVGFVAAEKRPRIALDVGEDAFYFDSPEFPDTRSELALPLIVRNNVIGVLDMQSTVAQDFHFDEIDMFQTLADQIAIAIDNARLLTESQLIISQLEIISNENTRRNWLLETSLKKPAFHYSAVGVRAVDEVPEPKSDKVLNIPLVLQDQKIGKISLHRKDEFQTWTDQEESVAKEVAIQTALALENIRIVERTRQQANREQELANVTARVRETLDLDTVLRTSAREIQRALNLEEAEVRLFPKRKSDVEEEPQEVTSS